MQLYCFGARREEERAADTHQQVVEHLDQDGVLPGLFKPKYLVHLD